MMDNYLHKLKFLEEKFKKEKKKKIIVLITTLCTIALGIGILIIPLVADIFSKWNIIFGVAIASSGLFCSLKTITDLIVDKDNYKLELKNIEREESSTKSQEVTDERVTTNNYTNEKVAFNQEKRKSKVRIRKP